MTPPSGAGAANVTNPVTVEPGAILPVGSVTDAMGSTGVPGVTVTVTGRLVRPADATRVVATGAGTKAKLSLVKVTRPPPAGAGVRNVTVPVVVSPGAALDGVTVSDARYRVG